jgi:hypothetical protein
MTLLRRLAAPLVLAAACPLAPAAPASPAASAPASASGPRWTTSLDEASGLPIVEAGGAPAVKPSLAFWGPNWQFAYLKPVLAPSGPGRYTARSEGKRLDVTLVEQAERRPDGGWTLSFAMDGGAGTPGTSGGGLGFHFDLATWRATMGEPELLPDARGWRWGREGGPQVEVRFDHPLAGLAWEHPGDRSGLRAFFYTDRLPAGTTRYTATWTFKDMQPRPTLAERLGGPPPQDWPVDTLGNAGRVPDLSFLDRADKPAGRHGPLRREGDRLVFADGTPARFWGTNVTAYALYNTPKDDVRAQARRLAALGFNLVRLHHHDSPWVNPDIFGNYKTVRDTRTLDPDALERLDWWIKCLKDEGIYVWLDLEVQRAFKEGDGIEGFDEIRKGKDIAELRGYNYVNPSIQAAMLRFDEAYLEHRNAFTKVANKDEPAIVGLLLTNENDVTTHFGNLLLPDKQVPVHGKAYMDAAAAFAKAAGLPADKVWRAWEPGAPKLFLNDLEHRFDAAEIEALRRLGAKAPIATTSSWGNSPVTALPALTTGDLIDVHVYGGAGPLEKDPRVAPNLVDWIGAAQVVGYPLTVSEWNDEPFPTPDRHVLPLYVAATASHQGWDALMQFAWTQEPTKNNRPSNWHLYNDPSLLAMMPAAALLYRERHVAEAKTSFVLDQPADAFFGEPASAANSPALRSALTRGRVLVAMPATPALPWLQRIAPPAGATLLHDPRRSVLPPDATSATSDTGELVRDWGQGVYTISTPRTRAAMGWLGERAIELGEVGIRLRTRSAAVAVQSLDERPIASADALLVSIGTRSQPSPGNRTPFVTEPAAGTVTVRAPAGMALSEIEGEREVARPVAYRDGRYVIELDGQRPVHWLLLRRAGGGDGGPARE